MRIFIPLKRTATTLYTLFIALVATAQTPGIHTAGNKLLGVCGDTIVLRGINYAPYDWGYDSSQLLLNEVAQTGANAVRMTWYAYSSAPYYTDAMLDSAIAACIRNKMIPIIELHNITCDATTADVDTLVNWYTAPSRMAIISKYQASLIINIANEVGFVNWASNTGQAQVAYENAYDTAVNHMRNAGISVPLLIDAPDCGTSIDVLSNVASNIIASDPLHNIIFSTHAYWIGTADNDSATMYQYISNAAAHNFPFIVGEVANYQDSTDNSGNTYYCHWPLNYVALLSICKQENVGWLVWSWNNDNCSLRQVSTDGTYANLSTFGTDIVNNGVYGLHSSAKLTAYLANGVCSVSGINNVGEAQPFRIYNDNGMCYVKSLSDVSMRLYEYDILGRLVQHDVLDAGKTIQLSEVHIGVVRIISADKQFVSKVITQ